MSCASDDRPRRRAAGQSKKPAAATRAGTPEKGHRPAPGQSDLDRPLKLGTARALASAGFYVRTNVVLSEPRAVEGSAWVVDVTDIDVLGITHGLDFRADLSCVSCKAGGAVKVLHETFALAGVMQYLRAGRGYAVFAKKDTEPQMIALAEQLGVMLMDDQEWRHWRDRIAGEYPVPAMFGETTDAAVGEALRKWTNIAPILRYLRTEFWYYRDYRNVLGLIARLRRAAADLNASPLARYLVLDAAGLLALAVLQLCEFVNASGLLRLRDTVPPYLFGGIATYRSRRDLLTKVEELLRKKNVIDADQSMPPLDPAYLNDLMELVLRYCNKPHAAARVPQQLNIWAGVAAAEIAGEAWRANGKQESDITQKLALDLIELAGRAASLPTRLMRALANPPASAAPPSATADTSLGAARSATARESLGATTAADPAQVQSRKPSPVPAPQDHTAPDREERQPDLLSRTSEQEKPEKT